MFDWVGGRTSLWSVVGLLPFEFLGFDNDQLLLGASEMDEWSRDDDVNNNPALLLALFWLQQTKGVSENNMVVLPYSDRLSFFAKYLQQLIMESLGKEHDLEGNVVNQGITVLGNKGSTDQHSYVQQLRSGVNDFFAIFVSQLKSDSDLNIDLADSSKVSDHLQGFFLGTREALYQNGRESLSIVVDQAEEYQVGALIALFERAVSFYAYFVNINAYDQPGVEAGKKAAKKYLEYLNKTSEKLSELDDSDQYFIKSYLEKRGN